MRPVDSFVGQSVRSLQTMLRVIAEDESTLPSVIPDGIYGQTTLTAVSAFQRRMGLPVTGVTDENTWNAIVDSYKIALVRIDKAQPIEIILDPGEILQRGDRSPYLFLMQAMLTYLSGYHITISPPSINGVLDSPTAESLTGFQVLAGLTPTGELDKLTWKHLVHHFTLNANIDQTM